MDFSNRPSLLKNFAFAIIALILFDSQSDADGVILCNCSNPSQLFDVDPRSMVALPSVDLQDQFNPNLNVSFDDLTILSNSTDVNGTSSTAIADHSTLSPVDNSTLILLDDLSGNETQGNATISTADNSTLVLLDEISKNGTLRTSGTTPSSSFLASTDTLGPTTTEAITDFILDDFTSRSTGMSASEDDLSFAAFDALDMQASDTSSHPTHDASVRSTLITENFNDLAMFDNVTNSDNQTNITLIMLDEMDLGFDSSNITTSHIDNLSISTIVAKNSTPSTLADNLTLAESLELTNSSLFNASQLDAIFSANWSFPVMSHTGKKKSSESAESSSIETSTLHDSPDSVTDFVTNDVASNMSNTNVTAALMSDDLSDSGESSGSTVTVLLNEEITTSSNTTQVENTVDALSVESSAESQENTSSRVQTSSLNSTDSSPDGAPSSAEISASSTLAENVASGEDKSTYASIANLPTDSNGTTISDQEFSSTVAAGPASQSSEIETTSSEPDPILDKKSSESKEKESASIDDSKSVEISSPKPTAKSRKPPTSLVPAFDCQGKAEGPYANPHRKCSHYFYLCADDEYFVQFCPANMYYDKTRFLCDGFDNVFDCSGVRHTRRPVTSKPTTSSPAVNFDCSERDDGDYEVFSCIEHFVTCFGGKAIPRVCSPGLLFDDNVKQCEFPKYIPKCGGHARTTPTTEAAPADQPATTVTYNFNCERRQDGPHADPDTPCSRHFFMCSSGRTFFLQCPDNLFFNRNSTECDYRRAVVECRKSTKLHSSTRKSVS